MKCQSNEQATVVVIPNLEITGMMSYGLSGEQVSYLKHTV